MTRVRRLEWLGLLHVQEIVVTHRGKYHIGVNLIVTRVEPKEEGPEIKPNLENPVFLYDFWYNDGGPLDFILTDDGSQLEFEKRRRGIHGQISPSPTLKQI